MCFVICKNMIHVVVFNKLENLILKVNVIPKIMKKYMTSTTKEKHNCEVEKHKCGTNFNKLIYIATSKLHLSRVLIQDFCYN